MNLAERSFVILKYVNKVPSLPCRAGKLVCREPLNAEWLGFVKALLE